MYILLFLYILYIGKKGQANSTIARLQNKRKHDEGMDTPYTYYMHPIHTIYPLYTLYIPYTYII